MGISKKQRVANQQNAKKSTGPRTEEGKARARINALKHGLLTRESVLPGEDSRALEELARRLRVELRPATELELLLVDRVASCLWRLRRALRVESAEIERSRIKVEDEREDPDRWADAFQRDLGQAENELESVENALEWLKAAEDVFDMHIKGERLWDEAFDTLADEHFQEVPQDTPAEEVREHARAQGWTTEKLRGALVPILRKRRDEARTALQEAEARARAHRKREEQSHRLLLVSQGVPAEGTLNRLVRYETTIERQLYRSLHEFRALQSAGTRHSPPPPIIAEMGAGGSNGGA